jgi:phage/conjugal plasmid C-4 type zinc finger TraR family protein
MRSGEREIETSEAMVELERQAAIARARQELATVPAHECVDCGEPIAAARRAAMPSARRCTPCQAIREATDRGTP